MVILIENLEFSQTLGVQTMKIQHLSISRGLCVLITGKNGSFKSTLLKLLAGKCRPTPCTASIKVDGKDSFNETSELIVYIGDPWNKEIMGGLRVKDLLTETRNENDTRLTSLIKCLDVNLEWETAKLSAGQLRRVQLLAGIANKLSHTHLIYLLDEVTNELDIYMRERFLDWLKQETFHYHCTVLLVSHIYDGLDTWVNQILFFKEYPGNIFTPLPIINDHIYFSSGSIYNTIKTLIYDQYTS
jgi:ABC-type uncharacterized transport system ATPase subunit